MANVRIIKTRSRRHIKTAVINEGNVFQIIPYTQFVAERIAELLQNHRYA